MLKYRRTFSDYIISGMAYFTAIFAIIITLYPFIYVLSMSISDPIMAAKGEVTLFPKGLSFLAYQGILKDGEIWMYYKNTIWYTVVGTIANIIVTTLAAFPLSRKKFHYRGFFMTLIVITMYFSGGMIPSFLVVVKLGLYDNRLAMILPGLVSAFNLIICRTYMQSIPEELLDAAKMDGSNELKTFYRIILPLSKPIIAVLAIYYGIGHWNAFFSALLYLKSPEIQPLQIFLRRVLVQASPEVMQKMASYIKDAGQLLSSLQIRYAVIIVVVLPIIFIYPFLQKHFVKGVMLGSLKG